MDSVPKKAKIFYGWIIVGACFLVAMYTAGIVSYGFTAIFQPIAKEFGWSYTEVSIASSIRGTEVGLFAPVVGVLIDRLGTRKIIFGGCAIIGLGLLFLSQVQSLFMFYAAFVFISVGMSACSTTALMTAVARWFHRKVGLALGILMCGYGFSGLVIPVIVRLVDLYGWRMTIFIFGIGAFVITLPLAMLVKSRPEDYGYLPDGDSIVVLPEKDKAAKSEKDEEGVTVREALTSPTFWFIALPFVIEHMIVAAVIIHIMPFLASVGIDRTLAGLVATALPVMSIAGRFGFGVFGDRLKIDSKFLAAIGFSLMGVGMLIFTQAAANWLLLGSFLVIFGIGYGGGNTLRGILPRKYFGMKKFGSILGFVIGMGAIGDIAGGPIAAMGFDRLGTYLPVWFVFAALAILSAIVIANTPKVKGMIAVAAGTEDKGKGK